MANPTTLDELLARPRDNRLILQFSTAAPDWKYKHLPRFCKRWPISMLFNKNWGSGMIRRANHSPFSHVDILMKDGSLVGASDSPWAPYIHGNPRGVASRPMDYQLFAYRRQMVLETDRAEDIRRMVITQLGKSYDGGSLKDMISDKFPGDRDWRLTDSWFCSELAAWAMETGHFWGPQQLRWPKNRVSPTDLLLMCIHDERWLNRDTFWQPIPGLVLGEGET
jgi:hypothetical protein